MFMTTACTCEYNLTIEDNKFEESIKLNAENTDEINNLNNEWRIPVDKEEYNIGLDASSDYASDDTYEYSIGSNSLTLKHTFSSSEYPNATAPSLCYNTVVVTKESGNMIISTSPKSTCFDQYPSLTNIKINITTTGEVVSNNADRVNGKTYTWVLTRNNKNKGISLVLKNSNNKATPSNNNKEKDNNQDTTDIANKPDYSTYILAGIILLLFLIGYAIYKNLTKDDERV